MDRKRIRQRHFIHGNSFKRIAQDYGVKPDVIAQICGVADVAIVGPEWMRRLPADLRGLALWCCEFNDVVPEKFHDVVAGLDARSSLVWHLCRVWGFGYGEIADLLKIDTKTCVRLKDYWEGREVCPLEPPLPDLPNHCLLKLKGFSREVYLSPIAIWRGQGKDQIHCRHGFLARLITDHDYSVSDVVDLSGVSATTLRRYVHAQKTRDEGGRKDAA